MPSFALGRSPRDASQRASVARRGRYRRHRVNPFHGFSAGAAALTGDTAPSASGRLTMARSRLPAIFGPAGRDTEPGRRWTGALSSTWCASWRTAAFTMGTTLWGAGVVPLATPRAASSIPGPHLGRVFGNQAAVGLRFGRGSCRDRVDKRSFRATGGVAAAVARSDNGDDAQDRARRGSAGRGWWGQASAMCVRKFSHSTDACRSVDAERNRGYKIPGHPLRTLFRPCGRRRHCSRACPLAGGGSLWSAERLQRACGALPY